MKSHELEDIVGVLNSVSNLCALGNIDESRRLLRGLTQFLRYKHSRREQVLPLADEIAMVRVLFELARARFGTGLAARLHVPDDCCDQWGACFIPQFSVLTFIENSILHAFSDREPPWELDVAVGQATTQEEIVVSIRDNGAGMSLEDFDGEPPGTATPATPATPALSTMMSMVYRLRTHYGADRFAGLRSTPGAGTEVTLVFPL